jgi:hypothetical protein
MAKPRGNLEKLNISKTAAAAAVPFSKPAGTQAPVGEPRALTVRLNATDYWKLRDFCAQRERTTGQRFTHQEAMVAALHCLLERAEDGKAT